MPIEIEDWRPPQPQVAPPASPRGKARVIAINVAIFGTVFLASVAYLGRHEWADIVRRRAAPIPSEASPQPPVRKYSVSEERAIKESATSAQEAQNAARQAAANAHVTEQSSTENPKQ